jgi:fucose permease
MMNLLHLFYGIGSTIGPKYAGWLLSRDFSWKSVYVYSVLILFIVTIFVFITPFPQEDQEHHAVKNSFRKYIFDMKVWFFSGVLGFCVVGELGIGNWLVNFLQVIHKMNENDSSVYLSYFFIAFTIGRLVGGFIAEKVGYVKALIYFAILYVILFSGGLFLGGKWIILFSLTGFSVSIMYPTFMTIIVKEFKNDTTLIMGLIITTSSLFNMAASWLIGKTSDYFGVYIGFGSLLLYMFMLIGSLLVLGKVVKYDKKENTSDTSITI